MKQFTILFVFLVASLALKAQVAEGFEGDFLPEGWAAFSGTNGSTESMWHHQTDFEPSYSTSGWAHTGGFATISSFSWDGPSEGWLVTPQFTPSAESHTLYFHQRQAYRQEYLSEMTVRVSSLSQTAHDDFTVVETYTEADVSFQQYSAFSIDLMDYIGIPIYVAFVHAQDDDDEWYIDDVLTAAIEYPGVCQNPVPANEETGVFITNTQTSHIDFSWEAPIAGGSFEQYDFYVGASLDELRLLGHPDDFEAHPSIFHFNTTYYWAAYAENMMGHHPDAAPWSFTTIAQPTVMAPYTIDFENEGFVPDGCDQLVTNGKWWKYANAPTPHVGNAGTFEGTTTASEGYFAYIDDSTSPDCLDTTFMTPFVDLSELDEPAFSFYMISNDEAAGNVDFSVEIGNEENGYSVVFASNTNTVGWEKKIVDLGVVDCTAPVQLRFIIDETTHTTKDDFAIDDIVFDTLSELTIRVDEEAIEGLRYYPNPVSSIFSIHALETINSVEVHNLIGQCVMQINPNAIATSIDMSNLSNGTYMLRINADNKSNTVKLIKE